MRLRRLLAVVVMVVVLDAGRARAFDQVVHHAFVYAIAVANGFAPEEAAVIADGSYSLDENDTTTAFSPTLMSNLTEDIVGLRGDVAELPHMRSGQVFHALASQESRDIVEMAHLGRIRRVLTDPTEPGTDEQRKRRALLYLGQYLHFAADLVVHPQDPMLGHGPEGHDPDRADLHPEKMEIVMKLLGDKVKAYNSGTLTADIRPTPPETLTTVPDRLDDRPEVDRMLKQATAAVTESWAKTYPAEQGGLAGALTATGGDVFIDLLEKQRIARASSEIGRVIENSGLGPLRPFRKIELDSDGEAIGYVDPDAAATRAASFGIPKGLNVLPFATTVANREDLREERARAVVLAGARGAKLATLGPMADAAQLLTEKSMETIRKAAVWQPPSSPGGVALNPRLSMPLSETGVPIRITMVNEALYLEAANGFFRFEGVGARSFATIARTVASGEVPYITIGTEPSDRPGFAKVTYAPSLMGTAEGALLYQADIQFKRIFAHLPFTAEEISNGLDPALFAGYPGPGGEFTRLWITSSDIRLDAFDRNLVPAKHGMRILSETHLRENVRDDPEMDAYVEGLTQRWDEIAERLWPFRAVEMLARATAIAFWAHENRIEIDPAVLLLPPRSSITPLYAPLVGAFDRQLLVAGGVALTPEDKSTTSGRAFLFQVSRMVSDGEGGADKFAGRAAAVLMAGLIGGVGLLAPALVFWLLLRRATKGSGATVTLRRSVLVWLGLCLVQIAAVASLSGLIFSDVLSFFDRDLLAVMATVGLFPAMVFTALRYSIGTGTNVADRLRARPGLRTAMLVLSLLGPLSAGHVGLGIAFATVAMTGPVPSRTLNSVLTAEIATLDAIAEGLVTASTGADGSSLFPAPRSLMETFRPQFERWRIDASAATEEIAGARQDPLMPFERLRRIQWPEGTAVPDGVIHYSTDGNPPF